MSIVQFSHSSGVLLLVQESSLFCQRLERYHFGRSHDQGISPLSDTTLPKASKNYYKYDVFYALKYCVVCGSRCRLTSLFLFHICCAEHNMLSLAHQCWCHCASAPPATEVLSMASQPPLLLAPQGTEAFLTASQLSTPDALRRLL